MANETQTVLIPGYQIISQLYAGSKTRVYRAIREQSQQSVVIKLLTSEYPNFQELLQFRNQYTISKNLQISGIIQPLALEIYGHGYILVMPDTGAIALREYIKHNQLSLVESLTIAIQISQILHNLHQNRVIHKDIKPANILIHPHSKQIELIDFSIASLLPKETPEIKNPNVLEGTLAYISPEQTGRMNRAIDYRSDFYSLGVTFYELLTGHLPFICDDPMELLHCHLVKPVNEIQNSQIPQVITDIVMKLMAKNAEDRYQSALGLKSDLEICLTQLQQTNEITYFEIGKRDICDRFLIREKLYGREAEVETLLNAFERVSHGNTEMMLVAGFSGIGKTAVVNEVHKPITRQQGYFIRGKFDQFNRHLPLSAFVQAMRDLMEQLLSQSDIQLAKWRGQILAAVGENGQVLTEVIPELECLLGKQPPAPELSATAAQNRFNLLLQKFIAVFTTPEHPLVMFLDDLQWADVASLQLMKLLMEKESYLFLVGAYRDHEVAPTHPLMLTVKELEKAGKIINTINLTPLNESQTNQLIAETLHCTTERSRPLTELIFRKTQGNPFFITQFLKALHEEGQITFNHTRGYWECDLSQIHAQCLTDDVVEFMAQQLQKLPQTTQEVLKLAACIGHKFDLATLAIVSQQSEMNVAKALWKALQEGLIIPQNEVYKFFGDGLETELGDIFGGVSTSKSVTYKFLHDRIQQAADSLIPEADKQLTHLTIGRLLFQNTNTTQQQERIFEIVNQLNAGMALITQLEERQQYAQLNWRAARKAKEATAYSAAQHYLNCGIELLAPGGWDIDGKLMHNLYEEAAEVALLSYDFEEMTSLVEVVLQHTTSLLDQVKAYEIQIQGYQLQNQQLQAIKIGREILNKLGVVLPESVTPLEIQQQVENTLASLPTEAIADLINLPLMQDANAIAALRIMISLVPSIHQADPPLFPIVACAEVNLSLKYGNSPYSAPGYADFGIVVSTVLRQLEVGYQFGQLALSVIDQFPTKSFQSMVQMKVAAFNQANKHHIQQAINLLQESYKLGLATGDSAHALISTAFRLLYTYFAGGEDLPNLLAEVETYQSRFATSQFFSNWAQIIRNSIKGFTQFSQHPYLGHDRDDEQRCLSALLKDNDQLALHLFYLSKVMLSYSFGDFAAAVENLEQGAKYLQADMGMPSSPIYYFYDSLVRLAVYLTVEPEQQKKLLLQVAENQEQLKIYAYAAPMNYQHKYHLVAAIRYYLSGNELAAMEAYDLAIAEAINNGYLQEAALANELAAQFYLDWGKQKVAAGYMQEAYYCYARWGAKAKTLDLEHRYPYLLHPIFQESLANINLLETLETLVVSDLSAYRTQLTNSYKSSINTMLDFQALLKASQNLSRTIQLDELLHQLTQIILQNSGGDLCALILPNPQGVWYLKAIATTETTQLYCEPLEGNPNLPVKLIQYVKNTQKLVVIDNLKTDLPVIDDYLSQKQPKSLLCLPILHQGKLIGILELKNHSTSGVFSSDRILVLNFLCTQAAISLENARLFSEQQAALSQRQLAEQEQQRLLRILDATPDIVGIADANNKSLYTNPAGQRFWQIQDSKVDFDIASVTPPQAMAYLQTVAIPTAIRQGTWSGESAIFDAQGNEVPVSQVIIAHKNAANEVEYLSTIIRDISEQKAALHEREQVEAAIAQKSQELERALQQLQQTQLQMVQNEKMSALGNLVAGVAHEMNNPLGFISASLKQAKPTLDDITTHLKLYQKNYPNLDAEILNHAEEIDLDYSLEELPKMIDTMVVACERLKNISTSLRTFSRADKDYKVQFNLHDGIDSTILILKHRLKANEQRPAIEVITNYGDLPLINCFPGQLNQVFMNMLANAIDALEEANIGKKFAEIHASPNRIIIKTSVVDKYVNISIIDNGKGMSAEVKQRIFDHLFTTKAVGKGTGLGMAIARQIVEEKHGGKITVNSALGQGTEFIISLPIA